MDWTQILIALITVCGTITGSVLVYKSQIKTLEANQKKAQQESAKAQSEVQAKHMEMLKTELTEKITELSDKIDEDRKEYFKGIKDVQDKLVTTDEKMIDLKGSYQTSIATIDLSLNNLTKQVEKHNSVIERTFILEKDVAVLKNRESVSENRLADLEGLEKKRHE